MFDAPNPQALLGPGLAVELHDVGADGGVVGERFQHGQSVRVRLPTRRLDSVVIPS